MTTMRLRNWRDLFVVHTKSIRLDQSVVDLLASLLVPSGFSIWGYDDWDWLEKRKKQSSWEGDLSRDGFLLDPSRAIEGNPSIKPRQVDTAKLDELISHSRAVLFLHPSTGELSKGMEDELFSLRRDRRNHYRKAPVPVVFWCNFENNAREPIPLGFGDGHKIISDWKGVISLRLDGDCICDETLPHISVWIAKLLLEQRIAHVAKKKAEEADHDNGYFGFCISDFECEPQEELERARTVLSLARTRRNRSRELESIVHELEEIISGIRPNDLNDEL